MPHLVSQDHIDGISKTTLKISDDKTSPCLRRLWIEKLSNVYLCGYILMSLTNIMGTANCENDVQYFPPHRIIAFLEVYE
jgi:hypothetical protein